jgi:hypothetical protein
LLKALECSKNPLIREIFNVSFFYSLQLDLQLQDDAGGDISSFVTNGEWDLLGKYSHNENWPRCWFSLQQAI